MATTPEVQFERGLPASIDAERSILGAILLDNHAYNEAAERITQADFALDQHRRIFTRMADLMDAGRAVDIVTLREELSKHKEIEAVGGVAYLASLTEGLPRRISIDEYVRIVKDKSLLRQLINVCSTAITQAADQSDEALEVLNRAESDLLQVTEHGIARGFMGVAEIVKGSFGSIDKLIQEGAREVTGLRTWFDDFDKMTSGLQKSELTIIAARPSMGKTAWAINIAQNAAVRGGGTVAVFSLEMSKESLLRRMLASEALVDSQKIQKGFLLREDQDKLTMALERLVEAKIFIDDTPGISLTEMRAKARRLRQMAGAARPDRDRLPAADVRRLAWRGREALREPDAGGFGGLARAQVSGEGAGCAGDRALAAVSSASEQRGGDKKPMLSDLRESGSIEQDADVVAFIHRDSYYNKDENGQPDPETEGKAEIIIAKQRNGPTGSVHLGVFEQVHAV